MISTSSKHLKREQKGVNYKGETEGLPLFTSPTLNISRIEVEYRGFRGGERPKMSETSEVRVRQCFGTQNWITFGRGQTSLFIGGQGVFGEPLGRVTILGRRLAG